MKDYRKKSVNGGSDTSAYVTFGREDPGSTPGVAAPEGSIREWLEQEKLVRVESRVLGEDIYFGSIRARVDGCLYLIEELEILAGAQPTEEGLKAIHEVKKVFDGTILSDGYEERPFNPIACMRSTAGVHPATCRGHIEQKDPNCAGCKRCPSAL
jgi:hypothetical protein